MYALERIAKHEKECAHRWGEVHSELKALQENTKEQADRWEKLAWLIITGGLGVLFTVISHAVLTLR